MAEEVTKEELRDALSQVTTMSSKVEKICDRLYSSDDGHTGDIPEMKEHLARTNGHVADLKACDNQHEILIALIQERQKYVFPRMLKDMPKWAQALVALSILGAITNLGIAVDKLVGIFV